MLLSFALGLFFAITLDKNGMPLQRLYRSVLVIPYAIVAYVIYYLGRIMVFFAFFTILFTKNYPEGMFNIVKISLRWLARASAYEYWMGTRYPPFEWD